MSEIRTIKLAIQKSNGDWESVDTGTFGAEIEGDLVVAFESRERAIERLKRILEKIERAN
jgi:hypothetical protein